MADVTYNTASFPSLVRTLAQLIRLGSNPPMVLVGYKERDAAERTLWNLAAEIGLDFEKIGEHMGAGGAPVEIWLGRVTAGTTRKGEAGSVEPNTRTGGAQGN
jgi:protein N-lysine methyltransferase METTL21D